jgi:hypothetical protein
MGENHVSGRPDCLEAKPRPLASNAELEGPDGGSMTDQNGLANR